MQCYLNLIKSLAKQANRAHLFCPHFGWETEKRTTLRASEEKMKDIKCLGVLFFFSTVPKSCDPQAVPVLHPGSWHTYPQGWVYLFARRKVWWRIIQQQQDLCPFRAVSLLHRALAGKSLVEKQLENVSFLSGSGAVKWTGCSHWIWGWWSLSLMILLVTKKDPELLSWINLNKLLIFPELLCLIKQRYTGKGFVNRRV